MSELLQIKEQFWNLTGMRVHSYSHPGLKNRDKSGNRTLLITSDQKQKYIMTFRHNLAYAELEAEVLKRLAKRNDALPNLVNRSGNWLVQEYISGERLTQALATKDRKKNEIICSAISTLASIQEDARKIGLEKLVKPICTKQAWKDSKLSALKGIAEVSGLRPPKLDEKKIFKALEIKPMSFIKWDSRPGNVILKDNNKTCWFDWEHCGRRAGIDDLVWFLSDEWLKLETDDELQIINKFIDYFDKKEVSVPLKNYLRIFGTMHMCGRLSKILELWHGRSAWIERQKCLTYDLMGVTAQESNSLAIKAARWANHDSLTKPLVPWLNNLSNWLDEQNNEKHKARSRHNKACTL
jgi:hypothetical protein